MRDFCWSCRRLSIVHETEECTLKAPSWLLQRVLRWSSGDFLRLRNVLSCDNITLNCRTDNILLNIWMTLILNLMIVGFLDYMHTFITPDIFSLMMIFLR